MSGYFSKTVRAHPTALGSKYRSAFKLLTAANAKTPKGEASGYFSAILYLSPHTEGGGATLCPYSTPACRSMCLAGAGLSGLPRQLEAKARRTRLFNDKRAMFLDLLWDDIDRLKSIAHKEGVRPALRLNGSSDVIWEAAFPNFASLGLQKYDYTKIPLRHRRPDADYHLTFSVEGPDSMALAVEYLHARQSVAIVVREDLKHDVAVPYAALRLRYRGRGFDAPIVDGDASDLRFLDPPGSIVLLKPKGHVRTSLVRPHFMRELAEAAALTQGEIA